jgi:hypothetical protein
MVPMMASLAAACIMIVIFASVIVALVMAAEYLRLLAGRWFPVPAGSCWPSVPPARVRSEAPPACRRHGDGGGRPRTAAQHDDAGRAPEGTDGTSDAPRPAEVLPFARKPARRRPPRQDDPPPDAAA